MRFISTHVFTFRLDGVNSEKQLKKVRGRLIRLGAVIRDFKIDEKMVCTFIFSSAEGDFTKILLYICALDDVHILM